MRRQQTTRCVARTFPGVALLVWGLAISGGYLAAQAPPGSPAPANPPPGAPAPQPHAPAGASEVSPGDGLVIEPEPRRVTGKIVRLEDNRITLETNDTNESLTFKVDPKAEIVLNKKPAKLNDLRPGDFIRLTLTDGENPYAELVWTARIKDQADQPDQTFPPEAIGDGNDATGTGRRSRTDRQAGGLGVAVANTPGAGVLVAGVRPETPAAQVGLAAGDYILALNNQPIQTGQQLIGMIQSQRPGQAVALSVWSQRGQGTQGSQTGIVPGIGSAPGVGGQIADPGTQGGTSQTQTGQEQNGAAPRRESFGENSSQFGNLPFESPESGAFGRVPFESPASRGFGGDRTSTGSATLQDQSFRAQTQAAANANAQTTQGSARGGATAAEGSGGTPPSGAVPRQLSDSFGATQNGQQTQQSRPGDRAPQTGRGTRSTSDAAPRDGVQSSPGDGTTSTADPTTTVVPGGIDTPLSGAPLAGAGGSQFPQGTQTVRVVLTSAQAAQDTVVDNLGSGPQSGSVNSGTVPGTNQIPFDSRLGTDVANQQVLQSLQQLQQELQTLRQEMFRLHGQTPPDLPGSDATSAEPFPMTTPPGSLPAGQPGSTGQGTPTRPGTANGRTRPGAAPGTGAQQPGQVSPTQPGASPRSGVAPRRGAAAQRGTGQGTPTRQGTANGRTQPGAAPGTGAQQPGQVSPTQPGASPRSGVAPRRGAAAPRGAAAAGAAGASAGTGAAAAGAGSQP